MFRASIERLCVLLYSGWRCVSMNRTFYIARENALGKVPGFGGIEIYFYFFLVKTYRPSEIPCSLIEGTISFVQRKRLLNKARQPKDRLGVIG